jgi:hypothetical protein
MLRNLWGWTGMRSMAVRKGFEPLRGDLAKSLMARDFWAKGLNRNGLAATGSSPAVFRCPPISTRVVETFWRRRVTRREHFGCEPKSRSPYGR